MSNSQPVEAVTTIIVRRAVEGEHEAVQKLCARFTPGLMALARRYLIGALGELYEPMDLVNDVWVRAIPRLRDINERSGRLTPVLQKFLATTLKFHYSNLLDKHLRGKPKREACEPSVIADSVTGVTSRLASDESTRTLHVAIEELAPKDREVIMLHGLEQMPHADVAELLGESVSAVRTRYARAWARLVERMRGTVFDDLADDAA